MGVDILKPGIKKLALKDAAAYVVLSGTAGTTLNSIIVGKAPLTKINIREAVSAQVSGALNNDVLVSTFGLTPVTITIGGLALYNADICGEVQPSVQPTDNGNNTTTSIEAFFKLHNVHTSPSSRVDLAVGDASYTCALLTLTRENTAEATRAGMNAATWEMSLIGARKN